jgi:hypothetical protein
MVDKNGSNRVSSNLANEDTPKKATQNLAHVMSVGNCKLIQVEENQTRIPIETETKIYEQAVKNTITYLSQILKRLQDGGPKTPNVNKNTIAKTLLALMNKT